MDELAETILAVALVIGSFALFAMLAFNALVLGMRAWLGRACRLIFPLAPCTPRNMVVVTRLDGKTEFHYNVKVEPGREHHVIHLPGEKLLAKGVRPVWAGMFAANYGPGSPMDIALRAIMALYYGGYVAFVIAFFDGLGLFTSPLARASLWGAFIFVVLYAFLVYRALVQPSFPLLEIVEWEKKPEGSIALPTVGPRGVSPVEFARLAGTGIRVDVPVEVQGLFERIRKTLGRDDIAIAALLARAEEAERLKVEISEVKRRELYSRQLARAMILEQPLRLRLPQVILVVLFAVLAFALGFYAGGGWVSVQPP